MSLAITTPPNQHSHAHSHAQMGVLALCARASRPRRGGHAQRKGLVPVCGAGFSGPPEPDSGRRGCGRLPGTGVKAPAWGKTLTEAGSVMPVGTLLSGRGREAL